MYLKSAATGVAIRTVHTPKNVKSRGMTRDFFFWDRIIPIAMHSRKKVEPIQ